MSSINISHHKSKIGEFIIGTYKGKLCIMDFAYRKMRLGLNEKIKNILGADFKKCNDKVMQKTKSQVDEYLQGKRKVFDLPLLLVGSEFQKQVWKELLRVPYGQRVSYLDLAKSIGKPEAVRAVANANGANSLALIVPCHRIIASDGSIGGYGGGVSVKKRLLKLEDENSPLSDDEKYDFIGQKSKAYNHKFITAVKTTRIYCLPSCSAKKPNRENVVFYSSKQEAMENGYRACKICKP